MNSRNDNPWHFTKMERVGVIIFLAVLFMITITWRLFPHFIRPEKATEDYRSAWKKFKAENLKEAPVKSYHAAVTPKDQKSLPGAKHVGHLFPFDPNTATERQLTDLGLPSRTVQTLLHYRNKGGRFYQKEDLKKLYTLSESDYRRIAPYVITRNFIDKKNRPEEQHLKINKIKVSETHKVKAPEPIALNKTNAETLIRLPGIGAVFSKRIIAFRNILGGFASVKQLKEVYGFPDSTFQKLKSRFIVDPKTIHKINLNTATEETLAKHPYISKRMAKDIIRLHKRLKKFSNIEQLKELPLINEEKYRKIAPYLSTSADQ